MRTDKTYLMEVIQIGQHPMEIFLDIEGIPDQQFFNLAGLLVCSAEDVSHHSIWANSPADEKDMFSELMTVLAAFPDAPIYHYGRYEALAVSKMAQRYHSECDDVKRRMVNVLSHVHGRVYFPVRSNGLKDIGHFLGASWSDSDASGLQALVWRHRWEEIQSPELKARLTRYNQEDCLALRLLVTHLRKIGKAASSLPDVDFADRPKRRVTESGEQLHDSLEDQDRQQCEASWDEHRRFLRLLHLDGGTGGSTTN